MKKAFSVSPEQFLSDHVRKALDGVVSGQIKAGLIHSSAGKVPAHLRTIVTEHGTVVYDPKKIKARGIRRSIKFGRFHEIAGLTPPSPAQSLSGLKSIFKFRGGVPSEP